MDFILGIIGKIIGLLMLVGVLWWVVAFFRAIIGLGKGESFFFFLPFGFLSSRRKDSNSSRR